MKSSEELPYSSSYFHTWLQRFNIKPPYGPAGASRETPTRTANTEESVALLFPPSLSSESETFEMEKYADDNVASEQSDGEKPRYSSDGRRVSVCDDVFGDIQEGGPNYRDVGWIGTAVLMMKTQIGLGVLAIPTVLDTLGMVPGVICLLTVGVITTWTNYMIGQFKLNHRSVYGIDDMGFKALGPFGREFFAVAYMLCKSSSFRPCIPVADPRSLDLCRRIRHARHLNRSQRCIKPRRMYCHLCCRRCNHRIWSLQHSDPRQNFIPCMDRSRLYFNGHHDRYYWCWNSRSTCRLHRTRAFRF